MKSRRTKPSRAAIKAAANAMKPSSTVAGLKAWQGRILTEAELELIEDRETKKPKLGIKL